MPLLYYWFCSVKAKAEKDPLSVVRGGFPVSPRGKLVAG